MILKRNDMKPTEHIIGNFGADRLIPHIYKEINFGVTPETCTVAVLDNECATYIKDYLKNHYAYMMDEFRKKDEILVGDFYESYKCPFFSLLDIIDAKDNLSFGNFGLYRSNEPIKGMNHILISPYSSLGCSVDSFVKSLDRYLFERGIVPERITKENIYSIEKAMSHTIARNKNVHSGVYACTPVQTAKGILRGYDNGWNGTVEMYFVTSDSRYVKCRVTDLTISDLNKMKPFFREFLNQFERFRPHIVNYSGKYVSAAQKKYQEILDSETRSLHKGKKI